MSLVVFDEVTASSSTPSIFQRLRHPLRPFGSNKNPLDQHNATSIKSKESPESIKRPKLVRFWTFASRDKNRTTTTVNATLKTKTTLKSEPGKDSNTTTSTLSSSSLLEVNGTKNLLEEPVEETTDNQISKNKSHSLSFFRRFKNQQHTTASLSHAAGNVTTGLDHTKNPEDTIESITESTNQTSATSTTTVPSTNETTTSVQPQPSSAAVPPPQGMIVTMGTPPPGYRIITAPSRGLYPQQQQQQRHMMLHPQNSLLVVEALGAILGTAMRLWFLTWLTKRIASQEESIQKEQHFVWERMNDKFDRDVTALRNVLREPPSGVSTHEWKRKHVQKVQGTRPRISPNLTKIFTRTVVVVELNTSGRSNDHSIDLEHLPELVTFLIQQQRQHAFGTHKHDGNKHNDDNHPTPMELEVLFLVDSPGGSVSTYGLAAAQIRRLSIEPGITTTVCVDKCAASGGYAIASQCDKVLASPFSTIGSIGVIMEGLNFHELAKRHGIQPLVVKAGEHKNPLSTWGPVSRQDLEEQKQRLIKVHGAFKDLVVRGRPGIVEHIDTVTDGTVFLGVEAKELALVDDVMTSDAYILERITAGDRVLRLHRSMQTRFSSRQRRITLIDLLPHLRDQCTRWIRDEKTLVQRVIQMGTWIGFLRHLFQKYGFQL